MIKIVNCITRCVIIIFYNLFFKHKYVLLTLKSDHVNFSETFSFIIFCFEGVWVRLHCKILIKKTVWGKKSRDLNFYYF